MFADIIIFLIVLLFVWLGYASGFIKTLFGMCSYFISIIIGFMIYPVVSEFLKKSALYGVILRFSEKQISINIDDKFLFNDLLEQFGAKAVSSLAELLINIISFVAVILICKIILSIVSKCLNLISKVPVISFFNRTLGAILGAVKGIILLYIVFLFVNFLPVNITEKAITDINESRIAYKFYNENIILDILGKDVVFNNGK